MKTNILEDVNRMREIMGLEIISEAAPPGGLITDIAKLTGLFDNIASKVGTSIDDLARVANKATDPGNAAAVAKLSELETLIKKIATDNTIAIGNKNLKQIITAIKSSASDVAKQSLLKTLIKEFPDEVQPIVSAQLKTSTAIKNAITNIDSKVMRSTLEELGLETSYIDDVVKNYYKEVGTDMAKVFKDFGLNEIQKNTELLNDVVKGFQEMASVYKGAEQYDTVTKLIKDNKVIAPLYDDAVQEISKLQGGLTEKNVKEYFTKKISNYIADIEARTGQKMSLKDKNNREFLLDYGRKITDYLFQTERWARWSEAGGYVKGNKQKALGNIIWVFTSWLVAFEALGAVKGGWKYLTTSKEDVMKAFLLSNEGIAAGEEFKNDIASGMNRDLALKKQSDAYEKWRNYTVAWDMIGGFWVPIDFTMWVLNFKDIKSKTPTADQIELGKQIEEFRKNSKLDDNEKKAPSDTNTITKESIIKVSKYSCFSSNLTFNENTKTGEIKFPKRTLKIKAELGTDGQPIMKYYDTGRPTVDGTEPKC